MSTCQANSRNDDGSGSTEVPSCRAHAIARNFIEPKGILGWLAGQIMANRPSNQQRNRWTLNQLAIDPIHRVLEIGCGPGWGLSVACELARDGLVVGVDPSTTMLAQARKRNSESVELGKLKLVRSRAEELPDDFGGPFDRVYSSNVFGFLKEPNAVFKTLYQHINPGGLLATTWLPRPGAKTDDAALSMAERIEEVCQKAGFDMRSRKTMRIGSVLACCVIAERPKVSKQ